MKNRSIGFWFWLALIICVVGIIGASFVQTGANSIKVKDLRWETKSGKMMSALLFVPKSATAENPAPAIVTSHGWYNNREMQDMNFVEYARRGYVVMSIDMIGHGNSDYLGKEGNYIIRATGMTDAVELMASLPYVDKTRIGVTGHSNGARAANVAVDEDNLNDEQLISAVLLVANDPTYVDKDKQFYNKFGSRDAAIVAARFDEFFFRVPDANNVRSAPQDYINQVTAQSFLNFGIDPAKGEVRADNVMYTQTIDGKEAIRAIYAPWQIHPWNTISSKVVAFSINFFEKSLGAPNPIPSNQQVWQWKAIFNFIGLVGFAIFVWALTRVLLETTYFSTLKADTLVDPEAAPIGKAKIWFWGSLAVGAFVSFYSYLKLPALVANLRPAFLNQSPVWFIACWAVVNALFLLILILAGRSLFGSKSHRGARISGTSLVKTILLSLAVVAGSFLLVFTADYLFKVDFRLWVIPVKAFTPDKFVIILKFAPFFLFFYIVHSIAVNSFNYVKQGKEWVNVAVLAFATVLGALFFVMLQYGTFFIQGKSWTEQLAKPVSNIFGIWLFPILIYFPLAVIFDRAIYKVTKNPYIGGIIFGTIMTIIACTNTLTY
jgi:dienelactone hydrolase